MLRTIIVLPDDTEISAGPGAANAIQKATITECVNSGEELTIGSVCANFFEATLFTPSGNFSISAGTEIKVVKEDENGNRMDVGVFIMEKPTRNSANTMKLVGYDRVMKLDKDLTAWLSELAEWPYNINTFAYEVCKACGLKYTAKDVPNKDYFIMPFSVPSVTGRQLMRWLGEICCSFCRADAQGNIEFDWYSPADAEITPSGDSYYFQNGLTYEDYVVAPVDAIQIRLADSDEGALWPIVAENLNSYIITGNPILTQTLDDAILQPVLDNILSRLAEATYTPCKVSVPASMNIRAGNIVRITDKNGNAVTAYVMTKTQSGQKDTLSSTGSVRRDSSSAINNKNQVERDAEMARRASAAGKKIIAEQTAEDVLRKLTNDGEIEGIWQEDRRWYINAQAVRILNLIADYITAGILRSKDGGIYIDLDKGVGNLARGVSAVLTLWDDDTSGFTRLLDDVIDVFVINELKQMQFSTIRDYAVQIYGASEHGEGVKLSIFKYRKNTAQPLASISFEWADGARSLKSAECLSEHDGENWVINPMEWL